MCATFSRFDNNNKIAAIKSQMSIEKIIGSRVKLARVGGRLKGLCPFHNEKTPSFNVNEQQGFYHCFGCGAHGDVLDFIQHYDGLSSLKEAVKTACLESGVQFNNMWFTESSISDEATSLYHAMETFTRICSGYLASSYKGQMAREYLYGRGVNDSSISTFRLGYCIGDHRTLIAAMLEQKVSLDDMKTLGIISNNNRAIFAERIIFPICDIKGNVIAFGGRTLSNTGVKYINSKEHLLFKKNQHFYSIHLASKMNDVFLVEGYLDVIALHQHGVKNVVASMGTAFTAKQLTELWSHYPEITVCFDGDRPGSLAMDKVAINAFEVINSPNQRLAFVALPDGMDPFDCVAKYGIQVLQQKQDLADKVFDILTRELDICLPNNRVIAEQKLNDLATKIKHGKLAHFYRKYFCDKFYQRTKKPFKREEQNCRSIVAEKMVDKLSELQLALAIIEPAILAKSNVEEDFVFIDAKNAVLNNMKNFVLNAFKSNNSLQSEEIMVQVKREFAGPTMDKVEDVANMIRQSADVNALILFFKALALWRELVGYDGELENCTVSDGETLRKYGRITKLRMDTTKEILKLMHEISV